MSTPFAWRRCALPAGLLALALCAPLSSAATTTTTTTTTTWEYDSDGAVTSETVEPDDTALKLRTEYGRMDAATGAANPYGLVTTQTWKWRDPASGTDQTRVVKTLAYDTRGRYLTTSTNAEGHVTTVSVSAAHGQMLSATDPNNETTTWEYDGWGRKMKEARPDGTSTTWAYRGCVDGCLNQGNTAVSVVIEQQWATVSNVQQQTVVPIERLFDALGREIVTRTWSDTRVMVYTDRVYDTDARLSKVSRPHTATQRSLDQVGWSSYTRDDLGRVTEIRTTAQTGTGTDLSTVSYNGSTITHTNPLLQTQTEQRNVLGKLKSVTDAAGQTHKFVYHANGQLQLSVDAQGNRIAMQYDALGRRTLLADPDMGTWRYGIDPLGRVWQQTDARRNLTQYTYDKLDRVTRRLDPDSDSRWVYDTATNGIGALAETFTVDGLGAKTFSRLHFYDSLGRPSKTTVRLDWDYTTSTAYDSYGRAATLTHSRLPVNATTGGTTRSVSMTYNSLGQVEQIKYGASVLWTNRAQDALGRVTDELLGNGLEIGRSFNAYTGRLLSIGAGLQDGTSGVNPTHQNDTYTYDALGNLLSRQQLAATTSQTYIERFTYDDLNRLVTTKLDSAAAVSYGYDTIGNLKTKPNVGTLNYPNAQSPRPHAVSSITGTVAGLTNPTFTYDANGNLRSGLNRSLTWTAANLPLTIDKLSAGSAVQRSEFVYGSANERIKQTRRAMSGATAGAVQNTVYYANAFEKEVDVAADKTFIRITLPLGVGYLEEVITGTAATPASAATVNTRYLLKDHLGSTQAIASGPGEPLSLLQRLSYDAWGRRRQLSGADDAWTGLGTLANNQDNSGYTGHEQLDAFGLVHMNARLYDPITGRHLSADPTVPDPANAQSLNRYSYVLNNALAFIDPTGLAPEGMATLSDPWAGYDAEVRDSLQHSRWWSDMLGGRADSTYWDTLLSGPATLDGLRAHFRAVAAAWIERNVFKPSPESTENATIGGRAGEGDSAGAADVEAVQPVESGIVRVADRSDQALSDQDLSRNAAFRDARRAAKTPGSSVPTVEYDHLYDGSRTNPKFLYGKDRKPIMGRIYTYDVNGRTVIIQEHSIGHMQRNRDGQWIMQERGHFNVRDANGNTLPGSKSHYNFKWRVDPLRYFWRRGGVPIPRGGDQ